jgi:hypothetical protein
MRILVITVAAVALSTASAQAQQQNSNTPPWMSLPTKVEKGDLPQDDHHATKADDKAYRSALDGIPQIKDHDAWRSVREAPKSKSSR